MMKEKPEQPDTNPSGNSHFEELSEQKQTGIVREFTEFLLHNKKWWLTPIILVLFLLGLLVVLSGTGAAPWIYTLF